MTDGFEFDPAFDAAPPAGSDMDVTPEPAPIEQDSIDEAHGMEARTMLKGIRLPEADPLPPELKREVRDTVAAHMRKYKIPQTTVAIQIGVRGESVISDVLRGKYKAEDSAILRKMNVWVDDDERRQRRVTPIGVYETNVLMSIRDAAVIAKKNARTTDQKSVNDERARIVMAIGPSGIGKSAAAIALTINDPNAILIRIVQRGGNDFGIARAVVEAAGWKGYASGRGKVDLVFDRLKHSGRLLIVDEAHRLVESGYEFLRDLADVCGIPILLLGTNRMRNRVDNPRMGLGRILDDQFSRRVAYVVDLLRGSDGKGGSKRPFFSEEEIAAIFKSDKVKLTTDGVEFLAAIACMIGGGMLGEAANIYEKARVAARNDGGVIDAALLRKATAKVLMAPGIQVAEIFRRIENQIAENRRLSALEAQKAARKAGATG